MSPFAARSSSSARRSWAELGARAGRTGQAGANDLTVTTADNATVGDTVLITGKITLKKDFGMGYKYDVIIEDGKVKVE